MAPEDPPGFVVRTRAQKAAWDNEYRIEHGVETGGWLHYGSTTAHGEIWIAGEPPRGPWLRSIDHPGVAAKLAAPQRSPLLGPGLATFGFDTLTGLHTALDRAYKLGVSLPDAPPTRFRARTIGLLQTTEAERSECDDPQRLDVHNGLMFSAFWDAAFDTGLVSFADDGTVLASPRLSSAARAALGLESAPGLFNLRDAHAPTLPPTAPATSFRAFRAIQ